MQRAGKSFVELILEDFIYHDPGLTNIEELFEDQFSKLFKIYIDKRRQNDSSIIKEGDLNPYHLPVVKLIFTQLHVHIGKIKRGIEIHKRRINCQKDLGSQRKIIHQAWKVRLIEIG